MKAHLPKPGFVRAIARACLKLVVLLLKFVLILLMLVLPVPFFKLRIEPPAPRNVPAQVKREE